MKDRYSVTIFRRVFAALAYLLRPPSREVGILAGLHPHDGPQSTTGPFEKA